MLIVVDTEEEFNWHGHFSRSHTSTKSVKGQLLAHTIFEKYGIIPTYVIDYCIANDPYAAGFFKELHSSGLCSIGAHLHPWINPPFKEKINNYNSFHGNLPEHLERDKIKALNDIIQKNLHIEPNIFKAGRYGFGPNTLKLLIHEGYSIDCSFVPYTNFRNMEGPSFIGVPDQPFWLDEEKYFLEIPMSKYFIGKFAKFGKHVQCLYDNRFAKQFYLPGILKRLGIERSVLTPEGVSSEEMINLIKSMLNSGKRVFTMSYHSPSLVPGNTPYVVTKKERDLFLKNIEKVFQYFKYEIKGHFITPAQVYRHIKNELISSY